ncbi:katanin p80 WD40 repeat-containing subunit B1 homolog KTN80.3-like isoform X2 [Silene latifolia]|uniref:katanin p80 WD40 repeat-containing subunit B1 homolog KTN80.3-like isoform X2 n=1 Tax=Silene latifolia TaxID=37657 RepID=UPI003D771598
MSTKRAYKLQEFVAHSSSVNCLQIGRKSSRVLVTGGEDHKVNLWAIGKPNALLTLSGHSSGIDSVCFDSSELLVAAGAASGTIKLWDLEEAKIVRTLTGHRSNCISVDFHPFGEFFASGSLDTNLKIWDIRRKGCIHTYKGHTRGVNAIRFTPDGRWVVSGGQDNTVKLWDLTAGKLMHEFKAHEGQIQCIDFHPHEFLLATGSSDKTVKFWDLETFELIGSAGPETSGVRCMAFNPDGRNVLCGLHESLKVYSWEPIRCHDTVDVGWSKLSDLNIHEGKLLGCSYNQSCVGVWVVDISRIEPYSVCARPNCHLESAVSDHTAKDGLGRLSTSNNSDPLEKETKPSGRPLLPSNTNLVHKDGRLAANPAVPGTPQRMNLSTSPKNTLPSTAVSSTVVQKRSSSRTQSTANASTYNKYDILPIIVPRNDARSEQPEIKREVFSRRTALHPVQSKYSDTRRFSHATEEAEGPVTAVQSETTGVKEPESNGAANKIVLPAFRNLNLNVAERNNMKDEKCTGLMKAENNSSIQTLASSQHESYEIRIPRANKDAGLVEHQRAGRTRSLVTNWEKREKSPTSEGPSSSNAAVTVNAADSRPINMSKPRGYSQSTEKDLSVSDSDVVAEIIRKHDQFLGSMQSRLGKLQAVHRFWERNDIKGAIFAMEKMADHGVIADVISLLTEKPDIVTLEICTCLLPLLASLLASEMDRHLGISLELLVKLVRVFGSVVYSTISASSSVGVDIEAEQRLERCNHCYVELERVKRCLPVLMRKGGSVAKSAQELNLALNSVCE